MLRDQISAWGIAEYREPATQEVVAETEAKLGDPIPGELRELLSSTDGVVGEYGLQLVWTAQRIGDDNARFRSDPAFAELYLPFEGRVFFADAGNGDLFAISLRRARDIYVWNHEDDSRTWVASTVMD